MTAQTNQPAKFLVPFAQNDSSRVELPVTTSDATRASQSLGFPPATMQPPEAGGVPPQGEDFNGALNQIARIAWWLMLGGEFAFDNAFATATQIGGYPKGAVLQSTDALGNWISTADNNTANPDTSTDPSGAGYVPGYQYGTTALTGLTGGTVTLTNAQAAKATITLAGALTSALTLIVPTWLKQWAITNNTTGAFAATIKTAAGTGVVIPQNGAPTDVVGDGTNITQPAENIATATQPTHAMQLGQAVGRLLKTSIYAIVGGVQQVSVNGGAFTATGATSFVPTAATKQQRVTVVGGGGAGGPVGATSVGGAAAGGGGGAGGIAQSLLAPTSATVTVGAGGASNTGATGTNGGTSAFGGLLSATGGGGGGYATNVAYPNGEPGGAGGSGAGGNIFNGNGGAGGYAVWLASSMVLSGNGGDSHFSGGAPGVVLATAASVAGGAAAGNGAGGSGGASNAGGALAAGGAGSGGVVIVEELS